MAKYTHTDISQIFYASNGGFKAGRDPMGIQNSSVATYSELLPGLTNLTGHIRYYSIYCLLLNEYDSLEKGGKTGIPHQYNFLRRAELIIAYIMRNQNIGAVIGSDFTGYKDGTIRNGDSYDIARGADYKSSRDRSTYWSYPTGAFGQYYLGSLIYCRLVKIEADRFYLLTAGRHLAQALADSLDPRLWQRFTGCVIKGHLTSDDITELQPLGLRGIVSNSPEWVALNRLLTAPDENGSTLRRDTIRLLLNDLRDGIGRDEFVRHRFLCHRVGDPADNAAFGWYFYFMCEVLHYCIETLLCYILSRIDALRNPPVETLIDDAAGRICALLTNATRPVAEQFDTLRSFIKERRYDQAAAAATELLTALRLEYNDNREAVTIFEQRHRLNRQHGILSEGLDSFVGSSGSLTQLTDLRKIIRRVMNEHTLVAVSKMGNSDADLRKFILEDGCAVLVEMRYPTGTSPRIRSLYNFLTDLGYIGNDGALTPIANEFIENFR